MHTISKRGIDFIKGWESFVPYPYDDKLAPVKGKYREWKGGPVKGTLTIGYGHTDAAKHPLKIVPGVRITEAEACEILDVDLDECEAAVNRLVKVEITQAQFDALVSITFNFGIGNLTKSSLLKRLNAGDYAGARAAFDLYVRSGGEVMRGLQRRRDAEQALWDSTELVIPKAPIEHPAEVDEPKPPKTMASSKEGWAAILAMITTIGTALGQAVESVKPLLESPSVIIAIVVIAFGLGAFLWWKRRKRLYEAFA